MVDKEFDKMVELIDDIDDNAHSEKIAIELLKHYHPKIILEKMYNTIIYRILALNFKTENKDYDEGFFDCQKEILKRIDVVAREFGINIEDVENNLKKGCSMEDKEIKLPKAKDVKKQIEEIAKVMCGGCGSGEECMHGLCATWYNAEKLYNANCRILPEDNIVLLSKEEYEKLQTDMRRLAYQNCNLTIENKNLKEDLDIEILKGKEAVEKFAKDLLNIWDDLEKWSEKYYEPHSGITPAHIKECIKQFRADEIKEG